MGNDNSVGKPIEFGRHRATSVIIGDNEPAVRGRALVGESAIISRGQGGRKLEAPSCQRIERSAGTPVNRQKAAGLAGRRGGHFAPLYRNDVDPAASKEVEGTGSDQAASANYDPHDISRNTYRSAEPAQARFIGYPLARPPV
jgi:hypothetical protein